MATTVYTYGDPTVIPNLIAQHIVNTAVTRGITKQDLSEAISEVTIETQTLGPALLQLTLIDPDWKLQRSGAFNRDANGKLQTVDVNYPEGTDVWWRLAMTDGASVDSSSNQPNFTVTFQHRIINYLMQCTGALGWPGGKAGSTRAQFIKMLVDKMPSELPAALLGPSPDKITLICPELNEVQPVASSDVYGTEIVTSQSAAAQASGVNKLPGLTAASHVTIKGQKPTSQQVEDLNTALGEAAATKAGAIATEALIVAGIGESTFNRNAVAHSANGAQVGIWQSDAIPADEVSRMANAFLTGGPSFQGGGAIKLSKTNSDPGSIANIVEAGGAGATFYGQWLPEAKAIISAFDGGVLTGGGIAAVPESDVAELTRGTPDNPSEDSWTCMQRLASEVNWMIFSSPQPSPGKWGNYLYYIDGPTCAAQSPSLYVSLSDTGNLWTAQDPLTGKILSGDSDGMITNLTYTTDNSAFINEQTKATAASNGAAGSKKVQSQTRIQTPQTPSQVMFNLICGVMEFNAGDVFVIRNTGTIDGRWIVEDVTHNSLTDLFAQFTLGPPVFAYPEPQANTVTVTGTNGQAVTVSTGGTPSTLGIRDGTGAPLTDITGYTNPLAKLSSLQSRRIDQGVDYSGSGPLLAIGNGKVTWSTSSDGGWPGGGAVVIQLTDGLYKGKFVYYAEDITPIVSKQAIVTAGQQLAILHNAAPNLEIGWGSGSGSQPIAQVFGQAGRQTGQSSDNGGVQTAAGRNLNALLVALGAPSGGPGSGPLSTGPGMPAAWPTIGKLTTVGRKAQSPANSSIAPASNPIVPKGVGGGIFSPVFGGSPSAAIGK